MTIHWNTVIHFKPDEFFHPEFLRPEMVFKLDDLRQEFGKPLIITSSYRDPESNKKVGGVSDSAHLPDPEDGLYSGIDLTVPGNRIRSRDMFRLVFMAFKIGFLRIGVYPKHLHLDIEKRLAQEILWLGTD